MFSCSFKAPHDNTQEDNNHESFLFLSIIQRLDKQSQLYAELAQMVRDIPDAPDQDRAISELKHYIDGTLIFVQNDTINGNIEVIFGNQKEIWKLLRGLFAGGVFKAEKLKDLTSEELTQLSDMLKSLDQCCYRGLPYTSFAYYIYLRDTESEEFSTALKTAQTLLLNLEEFKERKALVW